MVLIAILHFQRLHSWLRYLKLGFSFGAVEAYAIVDKDRDCKDSEEEEAAVDLLEQSDIVGWSLVRRSMSGSVHGLHVLGIQVGQS